MAKGKKPAKIAGRSKNTTGVAGDKDTRYVVVQAVDVTKTKYHRSGRLEGFTLELAQQLSLRAHEDQPVWAVISVDEHVAAQEAEGVVTYRDVLAGREVAAA